MEVKILGKKIFFKPETEEDQLTLITLKKGKDYYICPGGGVYEGNNIESLNFWMEKIKKVEDWDDDVKEAIERVRLYKIDLDKALYIIGRMEEWNEINCVELRVNEVYSFLEDSTMGLRKALGDGE